MIVQLMSKIRVQIDACSTDRSLVRPVERQIEKTDATSSFWVRLIEHNVQDAKRTRCGLPTDSAILARWWIAEHKPLKSDVDEWERSFERACELLGIDVKVWRKKLTDDIDEALRQANEIHVRSVIYVRRAMVFACAGIPTTIAKQYLMPLVDEKDYEHVADVDHGDVFVMTAEAA